MGVGTDRTCRIELNTTECGLPFVVAIMMLTVVRFLSPGEERSVDVMKTLLSKNSCGTLSFESSVENLHLRYREPDVVMGRR